MPHKTSHAMQRLAYFQYSQPQLLETHGAGGGAGIEIHGGLKYLKNKQFLNE